MFRPPWQWPQTDVRVIGANKRFFVHTVYISMSRQLTVDGDLNELPTLFYCKSNANNQKYVIIDSAESKTRKRKYPFFRKYFASQIDTQQVERRIVSMLYKQHNKKLLRIYRVTRTYYDAELLVTHHNDTSQQVKEIEENLDALHSLGIVYVDLKGDNMGYSTTDKRWKIFDFDSSGLVNKAGQWTVEAPYHYKYKTVCNMFTEPKVADIYNTPKCSIPPLEIDTILFHTWSKTRP